MLHLVMFSICRSVPHHFRGNLVEGRTWEVAHFVSQLVQERGIDRRQVDFLEQNTGPLPAVQSLKAVPRTVMLRLYAKYLFPA